MPEREAEVLYDDRIEQWKVDLYRFSDGDWVLEQEVGTYSTKKAAVASAEYVAKGGSVYLEKRDGSFDKRFPA